MAAAGNKEQLSLTMVDQITSVDPLTGQLIIEVDNYVWDPIGLAWVKETQPGGGGGGGGPATIADGADVAQGSTTDVAVSGDNPGTVNAHLRGITKQLALPLTVAVNNFPATQPISAAALPLPAGAAADATLTGGTQKAIVRGGAKGATAAADVTGTAEGADHQALDVQIYSGGVAKDPTAIRALTAADVVTTAPPANASENLAQVGGVAVSLGQKAQASSIPVVLDSSTEIDHDVANTLGTLQIAGNASPVDVPPTLVSANNDRVRAWLDRAGSIVVRRRKLRESYTAVFRLAEAAARLDQTFTHVANTNKQWATIHHLVGATKEVRLQTCVVWVTAMTAVAPQGIIELRQISAAPVTGNPAITPTPHRRGGTAAEAVCLYLPTTAGTEANVDRPLGHHVFDEAVSVATVGFAHPQGYGRGGIVLYDASLEDDEVMPPVLPVATLDGWAVVSRLTGATVMRATVMMKFTEEIP